jgi:hypothetical protein
LNSNNKKLDTKKLELLVSKMQARKLAVAQKRNKAKKISSEDASIKQEKEAENASQEKCSGYAGIYEGRRLGVEAGHG